MLLIKYVMFICESFTYSLHNTAVLSGFSRYSHFTEPCEITHSNLLTYTVSVSFWGKGYIAFITSPKRPVIQKMLKQCSSKSDLQTWASPWNFDGQAFSFLFGLCMWDLVPQPGVIQEPLQWKHDHCTTREVPGNANSWALL